MADAPSPPRDITLSCRACPHTWTTDALSGVSLAQWVTHLERQACPACGAAYRVTSQGVPEMERG